MCAVRTDNSYVIIQAIIQVCGLSTGLVDIISIRRLTLKLSHKLTFFCCWICSGLIAPVLSFLLLSRGCTLGTMSLMIGISSAVVLVTEFPSGVFADLRGRKNSYLLGNLWYLICYAGLFFTDQLWCTAVCMVFHGLGIAFCSGSLDALIISQSMKESGSKKLALITSYLTIYQCAALTFGAMLGGWLPNVRNYELHLLGCIGLTILSALLVIFLLKETPDGERNTPTLREHLSSFRNLLGREKALRLVFLSVLTQGALLCTVSTYWQPVFKTLLSADHQYLMGVLVASGYITTILTGLIMGRINLGGTKNIWRLYCLFVFGSGLGLFLLTLQQHVVGFMLSYAMINLMLGAANVPEQMVLNLSTEDNARASVLSASSFCQKIGSLGISLLSVMIVGAGGIEWIWLIAATMVCCAAIICALRMRA